MVAGTAQCVVDASTTFQPEGDFMPTSRKRDNAYWKGRLVKDGHDDLVARVEADEITMYKATQRAGYRKTAPTKPIEKLTYHWERASRLEREGFVIENIESVVLALSDLRKRDKELKANKTSQ